MADYTVIQGEELKLQNKDTELYHYWDFGDGSPMSNGQNPSHIYSSLGFYTISHWAQSSCGTCTALAHTVEIVSDLSQSSTAQYKFKLGDEVYFNRKDTELYHYWDFGDGSPISNITNPTHIYSTPGIYNMSHWAQSLCGICNTITKTVEVLEALGNVTVISMPGDANITIDGVDQGIATESTITDLPPGTHTIELTKPGYQTWTGTVDVIAFQTVTIIATLTQFATPENCPSTKKYEGNTITLNITPGGGISPYYVEFRKNNEAIPGNDPLGRPYTITSAPENIQIIRNYILTNEDIRTASNGTIDFSVFVSDSCPTISQTCSQVCSISIGCLSPVCNFVVS